MVKYKAVMYMSMFLCGPCYALFLLVCARFLLGKFVLDNGSLLCTFLLNTEQTAENLLKLCRLRMKRG